MVVGRCSFRVRVTVNYNYKVEARNPISYSNIPGGKSPTRQVRPSVGDSLTNNDNNSSPDVPRGRLEASIKVVVVSRRSFRVRVTDNYNYRYIKNVSSQVK